MLDFNLIIIYVKWIGKDFVKTVLSTIIASLSITSFVAWFILSKGEQFFSDFSLCREKGLGLRRCAMNGLDYATLLLIASFFLIWMFVLIRRKVDKLFIHSYYSEQIKSVRYLYSFLEDFPYEENDYQRRQFNENASYVIRSSIQNLVNLRTGLYKQEKLREYVGYLLSRLKQQQNISPSFIVPAYESRVEFSKDKKDLRGIIDYILKCLENNRVN